MTEPTTSPDRILELATGFMAAKYLFVGADVGLFAALADGPLGLDKLAPKVGLPPRTTRILADALVALGLIEHQDGSYRNTAAADVYLTGRTAGDLGPYLRFFNQLTYPLWLQFEAAVRTGTVAPEERTPERQRLFSEGVEAFTARAAQALAGRYDFSRHQRLLDLGGGTGSFLIAILGQTPHLAGTLFDVPAVVAIATQRLAGTAVSGRVGIIAGNFFSDPIPDGHDVVLVANIVNGNTPERNRTLLRRVRERVETGGRLLLLGMWTDATRARPHHVAMMAGTFLLGSGEGEAYSVDEVRSWLRDTGWRVVEQEPLTGEATLLVAEADG